MRLVCPNCAAQYEVDDSVIPPTGRDVQCSNCGHAWFQPGAYHDDAAETAHDAAAELDDLDHHDDTVMESVARQAEDATSDPYADDLVPEESHTATDEMPPATVPERRQLDPSMLDVLREEAERESLARRSEGTSALEMQPELGLTEVAAGAAVAAVTAAASAEADAERRDDVASLRSDDYGAADVTARGPRRGLLPDIEEINSTLAASSGRSHGGEPVVTAEAIRRRRSGFRLGFSLTLLVAAGLLALYLFAPAIAARVPALTGALDGYVTGVNGVRLWIDDKIKSSTEALRDTTP